MTAQELAENLREIARAGAVAAVRHLAPALLPVVDAFNAGGSIDMGRAAAASIILFFILLAFTMLQLLVQRKWKYQ